MSDVKILKYQNNYPGLSKKLRIENPHVYAKAVIHICLDELQDRGARLIQTGKATFGGTILTFQPVETATDFSDEMRKIIRDGEMLGMRFEKRLIDADKVDFSKVFAGASDFAKDTREAAQSVIDAQPTVGKWIPCGERLPEKDCDCLVTTSDGEIDVRGYSYSKGWGWDGFDRVIAWMPLPELYKG